MNFREKNAVQLLENSSVILEPDPRLLDVGAEKKRSQRVEMRRVGIF